MALTRAELKFMIKEILVEILGEGLGSASVARAGARVPITGVVEARRQAAVASRRKPDFDPRLDSPLAEAVKRNAGSNSVMQDILADTAMKTLPSLAGDRQLGSTSMPESYSPGSSPGGAIGVSQVEQINGTPEEVFGEDTAGRWADLAFAGAKKSA